MNSNKGAFEWDDPLGFSLGKFVVKGKSADGDSSEFSARFSSLGHMKTTNTYIKYKERRERAPHRLILPIMRIPSRQERQKSKNTTFVTKLDLLIFLPCLLTEMFIIPTTTLDTKNSPPNMLFRPISLVPSLEKEIILERTSGAPFPRERRVIPAKVGESLRISDKPSSEEQK